MSIELHRMASLVIYANANLQGTDHNFSSDLSTIKFVEKIVVPDVPPEVTYQDRKLLASDPSKWIDYLRRKRVNQMKIHHYPSDYEIPDYITVAFVDGGGRWVIEAIHGSESDIWEKGLRAPAGGQFFGEHFLLVTQDVGRLDDISESLDVAREKLKMALNDIEDFASGHEHTRHWIENFKNAQEVLSGPVPKDFDDIIPLGILKDEARELIAAAISSWIFGGMGSWTDYSFTEPRYEEVTTNLYNAIHQGVVTAVNSYP